MNKKALNILFLGGAKRVSLAEKFMDEGKESGISINIFSYELDTDVPISLVGEIIRGLGWNDSNLYNHLIEIIAKKQIDIIIPFLDYATIVAARLKEMTGNMNVFIPVSDNNVCELFFNKYFADEWCMENGVSAPSKCGKFPLIAKPIHGLSLIHI